MRPSVSCSYSALYARIGAASISFSAHDRCRRKRKRSGTSRVGQGGDRRRGNFASQLTRGLGCLDDERPCFRVTSLNSSALRSSELMW